MKQKQLMVVDAMNAFYRSYFAYKRLSFKGESVSVIYGMPSIINELLFRCRPDELMIIWDGQRSLMRQDLLPDYKGDRKNERLIDLENLALQKKTVRRIFHSLGVKQILNPEAEADDMIYKITQLALKKGYTVQIVSSDKDFNQLLVDDRVTIWNPSKNDQIHAGNCKDYFGYTPEQCVDYLSLVGDKSDNIPGYFGIGEKKAAAFFEEFGSIANFLEDKYHSFKGIDRIKLKNLVKVNSMLINLSVFYNVNQETLKTVFYKEANPKYNYKAFMEHCEKFGLNKFMGKDFTKHFKMLQ